MSKKILTLIMILVLSLLTACAGPTRKAEITSPAIQPVMHQTSMQRDPGIRDTSSAAGLWNEVSARDLFQDLRAHKVGDLVTVNIVETSKASKKANTQSGRESSIDAGIDNLLGWEGKIKNVTSLGNDKVRQAYDNTSLLKGSLSNSFTGSGTTSRDESMTASITARVVEVRPNGNLYIEGTRQVKVNNETQFIILSGLIRPVDISPDNTVLSSYIGDAKIEYIGSGSVSDKQKPGWLARAVDFAWPF